MWDELTWKFRVLNGRANYPALALTAAFVLFIAIPFTAPILFGPRGDLLALVFEWLMELAIAGALALFCGWLFFKCGGGTKRTWLRWASFAVFLVFASLCLVSGWNGALSAIDLLLPFKQRQVVIAKTYYEHPQTGRGAMPESGGWHIVTADRNDYVVRSFGKGNRLHAGSYKIQLSRFKNIVMVADPVR